MSLPVIAITNASTCLNDEQVAATIPALQQQVSLDFKAYWDLDCQLICLPKDQALTDGWWQISVIDNPDQAGALGYHELTSLGTPLGKVFAGLDIQTGGSWTVTLSHELLEMLADPWINWCAEESDAKVYALEVCDAVEVVDELGYKIDGVLVSDFVTPSWFEPPGLIASISNGESQSRCSLPREDTFPCWARGDGPRSQHKMRFRLRREAGGNGGL